MRERLRWSEEWTETMNDQRKFLNPSVRLDGMLDVVIVMGLSASWLGLLGGWHWALDLLSHFRWQYLVVSLLAVVWTLWRRRRLALMVSLMTVALNGWLIGGLVMDSLVTYANNDHHLRVVSLNVLTSNPNKERVLEYLRGVDADVIFLMEVDEEWLRRMEPLKDTHPHGALQQVSGNFGVALYSRLPLEETKLVDFGEWGLPAVEARLRHEGGEAVILGLHPMPPVGRARAEERDRYLSEAAAHAARQNVPALVIGDLNATPWSAGARLMMREGGLRLAPGSWKPTWQARNIFAIPIDHAFCSAGLVILNKSIGPDVGSDHRPIVLEVSCSLQ
jgi:endonuclease/exonuclease/phosphatase (EEP) superfamily protein YafD